MNVMNVMKQNTFIAMETGTETETETEMDRG